MRGPYLIRLKQLAHDVLIDKTLNSTAVVYKVLELIDFFNPSMEQKKTESCRYPKIVSMLHALLELLQPDASSAANQTDSATNFSDVKEWLKRYLPASYRSAGGSVAISVENMD